MKKIIFSFITIIFLLCFLFIALCYYAFMDDKTKNERYIVFDLKNNNQKIYYCKSLNQDIYYKNRIDAKLKRNSFDYDKMMNNRIDKLLKINMKEQQDRSIKIFAKDGRFGVMDDTGNILIEPNKIGIIYIKDYIFKVEDQDKYYIYDTKRKKIIFKASFLGDYGNGLIPYKSNNNLCGYINYSGDIIIPPMYTGADQFSEGIACVCKKVNNKTKIGYINTKNETVIPFQYDGGNICINGKVLVVEKNKKIFYHKFFECIYYNMLYPFIKNN